MSKKKVEIVEAPVKCPICDGYGRWTNADVNRECSFCHGKGVV